MKLDERDKEAFVQSLFSSIAPKYDLLNSVMSLSRHRAWRRFAVAKSELEHGGSALDVCCGTGDFAFELAKRVGESGRVAGVDFAPEMIELAEQKARQAGLDWVEFSEANACALPFADCEFDCVTVGFGLRNVSDLRAAVSEIARVAKPCGRVISLEAFGQVPRILSLPFRLYFGRLVPLMAGALRAKREAYEYLPWSVEQFVSREELTTVFEDAGLADVARYDLMMGAVSVHVGMNG